MSVPFVKAWKAMSRCFSHRRMISALRMSGSPPVKTKSHAGVISSIVRMLRRIAFRLKPVQSSYSCLLMQKGQWLLQS